MTKPRAQVLHVEDQLAVAAVVQLELERAGIGVLTVPSAEECLMLAREEKFDLILLDETLPGMNGLELCRRLKADLDLAHIPVLFFSGTSDPDYATEALGCGAVGYLLKGEAQPHLADYILAEIQQARDRAEQDTIWLRKEPPDKRPPTREHS